MELTKEEMKQGITITTNVCLKEELKKGFTRFFMKYWKSEIVGGRIYGGN